MATKTRKTIVKKETTNPAVSDKKASFAENYGSTILGFIVVLILGSFLFNVFRGDTTNNGEIGSGEEIQEQNGDGARTHTVAQGEDLWKISEKYFNSGYNWTDIAKANNITNPNDIEVGQTLTIPNITPNVTVTVQPTETADITDAPIATTTVGPTAEPTDEVEPTPTITQPAGGEYTVVRGDTLWSIAVSQYNDGYKWVEIARANNLVNPDVIHAGNVLTLP